MDEATGPTTLTKSFHRTEYRTRKTADEVAAIRDKPPEGLTPAEKAWASRVRRALCGVEGCTCATTELGER